MKQRGSAYTILFYEDRTFKYCYEQAWSEQDIFRIWSIWLIILITFYVNQQVKKKNLPLYLSSFSSVVSRFDHLKRASQGGQSGTSFLIGFVVAMTIF